MIKQFNNLEEKITSSLSKTDKEGRLLVRETSVLEFKENFNFGHLAAYTRVMASFANNKGGILLFGVKDSPRIPVGIKFDKFNEIKQERITSFLLDHFLPEIEWTMDIIKIKEKFFGYFYTFKANNIPIICKRNKSNCISNGDIYYRYRAQTKQIEYAELSKIIEKIKKKEQNNWMSLFKQIAKIGPENSALLDIVNGKIEGQKGTLLIDEQLIPKLSFIYKGKFKKGGKPTLQLIGDVEPVSISREKKVLKIKPSNDSDAVKVKLTDEDLENNYPWDFKKLTLKLKKRYIDFLHNQKYHHIRQQCIKDQKYSFRRLLNPQNPQGTHKDFYAPGIFDEFDKYYKKCKSEK